MPSPKRPRLREIQADPAYRAATRLLLESSDGPQRSYYVGVRMVIMRHPNDHGYRVCRACGEPYLPEPGNHTRSMRASGGIEYRRRQVHSPAA